MYEVYYIGGPWDLTKRVFADASPKEHTEKVMYSLEKSRSVEGVMGLASEIRMGYCKYELSKFAHNQEANRDVYTALFLGWAD